MGIVQKTKQVSSEDKALLARSLTFMSLSRNAYDVRTTEAPDGWKIVAASNEKTPHHIEGFFARLYARIDENGQLQYALAFRGTDKFDLGIVKADVKIALLRLPHQYEKARKFVEDICRERNINPANLIYTGHSLGGYLASTIGASFNAGSIWTFNAPAPDLRNWFKVARTRSNASATEAGHGWVNIRSTDDVIGKWGYYKGAKTISIDTPGAPHGIDAIQATARQIINGEPLKALAPPANKGLLSHVFNAAVNGASKLMARSKTISLAINFVMADGFRNYGLPGLLNPLRRRYPPFPSMA